ncbi:hypothetical protein J3T91_05485 [Bifidobacterium sp. B4001]|uniref:hypothetical protein n=1 Tax=unclassified Bifidobacterium TaxID=2608897 RepID=UPI00226B0018|nr:MULTISPECIES: hypothetical protein [unclassified Bifidobacterium]MCX8672964.1 hypothetical protein [Bifidobacterium sp. B4079]MCX8681397.1 hypothetical protein [Bifidobacterium sp. B4001]
MDEETQVMPSIQTDTPEQEEPPMPPPTDNGNKPRHSGQSGRKFLWLVAIIAFLLGIGMASCGDHGPKESQEYKDLAAKYSETADDLKRTRKELDRTEKDLKTATKKADQWDKEQADKKAAEEKAAKDRADQEQAQQQAQQQAAQQAQQRAAQQAQQQATKQQPATAPVAPEPRSGGGPTVHRGAFCTPAGATGHSDRDSNILTCRTARDGRLRWMN